jgi:endonuclease/exonuclease/phosphatase (EEP) superfamily protein YafD
MKNGLQRALSFLAIMTTIALAAGFFGRVHAAFDSLAHFRVHLAVLTALLVLPLLFSRYWPQSLSTLLFAAAALSTALPVLPALSISAYSSGFEDKPADQAVYHLLQMNLRFDNPTPEKVLSLIGRTQPDVITLDEVSDMWKAKFQPVEKAYPYTMFCPYPNGHFGVGLMSRRPFTSGTTPSCYGQGSLAVASVDFSGTSVDVAAIHLGWPWPFEQAWRIRMLAEPVSSLGDTAIMAGDCNATPWSAAVMRVAAIGGFRLMPSLGPTWLYRKLPDFLYFAGLPLDQVFHKGRIVIHSAEKLEDTGSDHLPVMVEFSLRPQKQPQDGGHQTARAADAETSISGAALSSGG